MPEEVPEVRTCGSCANAYGFCWPGKDGRPLSCRCPYVPELLVHTYSVACKEHYEERESPMPEEVFVKVSDEIMSGPPPRKVVPFYRAGQKEPIKYVWADCVPIGGISADDPRLMGLPGPEL